MRSGERLTVSDLAALGQLLEEYRSRLLDMLRRRIDPALGVRMDAEEILSEAFLRARQRWADYCQDRRMAPYAWLYRIALDCLIEAWRSQTRGRRDLRRDMPWPEQSSVQLGMGLVHGGTSPSAAQYVSGPQKTSETIPRPRPMRAHRRRLALGRREDAQAMAAETTAVRRQSHKQREPMTAMVYFSSSYLDGHLSTRALA